MEPEPGELHFTNTGREAYQAVPFPSGVPRRSAAYFRDKSCAGDEALRLQRAVLVAVLDRATKEDSTMPSTAQESTTNKNGKKSISAKDYESCIASCVACVTACESCAAACLQEQDVKAMARCITLDRDCADVCSFAVQFMSRGSAYAAQVCTLCAEICDACEAECAKHKMEHCQQCAQACHKCAEECRKMSKH